MSLARPITFWITMLAVAIVVVVLLREVLLPFVAGMMLAYLLDPLASRLEQLGMNRLTATLHHRRSIRCRPSRSDGTFNCR